MTVVNQEQVDASANASDMTGTGAHQAATTGYVRSPEDVLRLVVFLTLSLIGVGLTLAVERSILGFEQDLVELLGFLSPTVIRVINGSAELISLLIAMSVLGLALSTRRYRLLGYMALAAVTTFAVMTAVGRLIDRGSSEAIRNQLISQVDVGVTVTSGVVGLSQFSAVFIVIRPFVGRRWRTAGIVTVSLLLLVQLFVHTHLPVDLFLALPVGATVGTGVLLLLGRPDRHPTLSAITASLRDAGLAVRDIHRAQVKVRGSVPYFATLEDGSGLFVKVLGGQQRAADLLFRIYRFLKLKNVGDDRPFSSLRRTVEHEALVALLARTVGIRTPLLRAIVEVGDDSMLLAYEWIDGTPLDRVPLADVSDELLTAVWEQIAVMRSHRIAHRGLRRANVFVQHDGVPWIIDFGFSEVAVADEILDADVAQLLASFAVVVGEQRAVTTGVAVLGRAIIGDALPRLQAKALSATTQAALKEQPKLLQRLQAEVIEQCEVGEVKFAELERVDRRVVFGVLLIGAATYFLLPQLADLPGIIDQVRDANWGWTPLLLLGTVMTYVGAATSLGGAVPQRLPAGPLFVSTIASSFASKLAPAGLGGMALNARFLQKQGVDEAVAVSGSGLNTVAGFVGHIGLVGVFIIWAGRDAFGSIELPDPKWFLVGAGVAIGMMIIGLLIPKIRSLFTNKLLPSLRRGLVGVGEVLSHPGRVAMLLGGSSLITMANLTTFYFAMLAFGGGLPFAAIGAIYLVGSALATAAPTPGGLGAVEAALIGGLVAAGVDKTVAVPAVFLYRLFTFWVPILPGWLCLRWMQRHDYL